MGTRLSRTLFIPDVHVPFHDKTALKIMLDVAKDFKADRLVFLGDFLDFYCVSSHQKDPHKDYTLLRDELNESRGVLEDTIDTVNAKAVVYLQGNHEQRLERYIADKAPKLGGLFQSSEILGLPSNVLFLPYGQKGFYKIGNLVACHGSRGGENPAATVVKKYRANVIFGHTHRLCETTITNIHGDSWTGINAGWLGDPYRAAEYIKDMADWTLGFVLTWHKSNGTFYHQLVHIKKEGAQYSCFFNNALYVK